MTRRLLATASIAALIGIGGFAAPVSAFAQETDDATANANNPLADVTALNLQNYYIGDLTGPADDANQFVVRYAQPVTIGEGSWLVRASLPLNSFPTAPDLDTTTGLGDLNVFAAYLFDTGDPSLTVGLGPQITVPTHTEDGLGSDKTSLGLAQVTFKAVSPQVQVGYLLTWQHSVMGPNGADTVNVGALQPIAFYQLGGGHYVGGAPIWVYNFENDNYSVPLGIRYGRAIRRGNTVYNLFVEPQWSIADRGPGQPDWQVYFALNMQFY